MKTIEERLRLIREGAFDSVPDMILDESSYQLFDDSSLYEATLDISYLPYDIMNESDSQKTSFIDRVKKFIKTLIEKVTNVFKMLMIKLRKVTMDDTKKLLSKKSDITKIIADNPDKAVPCREYLGKPRINFGAMKNVVNNTKKSKMFMKLHSLSMGLSASMMSSADDIDDSYRTEVKFSALEQVFTDLKNHTGAINYIDVAYGDRKETKYKDLDVVGMFDLLTQADKMDTVINTSLSSAKEYINDMEKKIESAGDTGSKIMFTLCSATVSAMMESVSTISSVLLAGHREVSSIFNRILAS